MTTALPPALPLAELELDAVFKRLNLANARRVWRDLVARAEREDWPYDRFLTILVAEEIAHRQQTRLTRLTRRAGFPFLKTIDDFDFTYQSTVRLALLGSALSPDFLTEGRALILAGKPGRGKTHLAVAIAYRAIQNGFDAHFVTAAELIDDLSAAFRQGRLAEALTVYTHPALLVVDEVGYLTYGTDAANMRFHVVNDRHKRRRAMIFTTNKPLSAWGRVLHDDDLALAIVDRILERGRLLTLDGPSMRTKHLGLEDLSSTELQSQVAKLSGIRTPEFPEPTAFTQFYVNIVRTEEVLQAGPVGLEKDLAPGRQIAKLIKAGAPRRPPRRAVRHSIEASRLPDGRGVSLSLDQRTAHVLRAAMTPTLAHLPELRFHHLRRTGCVRVGSI